VHTEALVALGAALAVLVGAALGMARVGLIAGACLLAGAVLGDARLEAIDAPGRSLAAGDGIDARAVMLAAPRTSRFGWSAELELSSGARAGARVHAVAQSELARPRGGPGTELRVRGTVRPPGEAREFDWAAHLRRRGIAAELALSSVEATGSRRGGLAGFVDSLRRRSEDAIEVGLKTRHADLLRGMVLGQDERIDPLVRADFRDSGLAHLLAVSGYNVMLLAALALPLLGLARVGPSLRTAALLGLIALYVPLAGAGPSLQRAAVMGAAGLIALAAARPPSRSYALLLAAAVTLALNPRVAGDPGWQLSLAAVGGILWVAPALRPALRFLPRPLAEGAAITLAATLATAPLIAFHFDSVPLAGLPANLLALPVVPIAMWAGMVQCGLGQMPIGESASEAVGRVAGPALAYLDWLARTFAELPVARLALPLDGAPELALGYGVLGMVVAVVRRWGRRDRAERGGELAGRIRRMSAVRRLVLVGGLAALPVTAVAVLVRSPAPPDRLTVRFLDVGQGDATLVQHPDGTAVLFDGGPPEARTVRLLRDAGVRQLAVVVATHASRDHEGGLGEVIERIPVGLLLDGGDGTGDRGFRALLANARRHGVRRVPALAPLSVRAGGLTIRVLSPRPRHPGPAPEDPNLRAVVAVVSAGSFDLLLSADAESDALGALPLPDVDAIKVPHHGSSDPGLPEILDRLRPEAAAIEVGENDYGHPAPSTLAALREAGIPTWRTDRDGTVTLTADRDGLHVATER
jgi:competence protein ComEC